MNLWTLFTCSLLLPKKDAMFRLNRAGMGKTIGYLLLLFFVASIPKAILFGVSPHPNLGTHVPPTLFVLQFFVFYYLLFAFIMLIGLSILAAIGSGMSKLIKRKLTYRQLWKMSAFTITLSLLLYTLAEIFQLDQAPEAFLLSLLTLVTLFLMIRVFPRRKA